jgi:AraC family transcriptional regulator, arabinose operon regulatory protein
MQFTVGHLKTKPPHRYSNKTGRPYWIMGVTLRGRVRVNVAGHVEAWSGAGTMTITRPGISYEVFVPDEGEYYEEYFAVLSIPTHWPVMWEAWPQPIPGVFRVLIKDAARLSEVAAAWKSAFEEGASPRPRAKDLSMLSLQRAIVLASEDVEPAGNSYDPRVRAAITLAHQRLAEALTVEQMAKAAHLSASRFAHVFSREVGVSPMRYLENARVERAKDLLKASGAPIRQVCIQVGFASPFHFSRRFRARVGMSPSEFRDNL